MADGRCQDGHGTGKSTPGSETLSKFSVCDDIKVLLFFSKEACLIADLCLSFDCLSNKGNFCTFLPRLHVLTTRTYINDLRHSPLSMTFINMVFKTFMEYYLIYPSRLLSILKVRQRWLGVTLWYYCRFVNSLSILNILVRVIHH